MKTQAVQRSRQFVRRALDSAAGLLGLSFHRQPAKSLVQSTLASLRPVTTGVPLVRIGGTGDGGYLVPDCFDELGPVFSPGVGGSASFELFFAEKGLPCHLLDGSVNEPPEPHENFHFTKKFLGSMDGPETVRLETWMAASTGQKETSHRDLLLQMDIEGAEWQVLQACDPVALSQFRIVVVELHDFATRLSHPLLLNDTRSVIDSLREIFVVAHVHINNCCPGKIVRGLEVPEVVEVTFLRKDFVEELSGPAQIPHSLDLSNNPGRKQPSMPRVWLQRDGF